MNNILSCFGLVDARISASEKDYPVQKLLIMEIAMIMVAAKNLFHYMVEEEKETYGSFEI